MELEELLKDDHQPILTARLLFKSGDFDNDSDHWNFRAIASDEIEDIEGDSLKKSIIDVDYANKRGYVNWHHSRHPEDQIGYLSKAAIIDSGEINKLEDEFQIPLSKTASVYVEGSLYQHVPRAGHARNIMKSVKPGYSGGVGVSIDGKVSFNELTQSIEKAYVRGVAFSAIPANLLTMSQLLKTLKGGMPESGLFKSLNEDQATMWLLKKRPHWTYNLAHRVAKLAIKGGV